MGGFTRASVELHISQSTVSQHIKALEDELGCALFLRVGRRTVVTASGRTLLEYVERVFQDLKDAAMAIREMNALQRGTLRFGTGATTLAYRLPAVLAKFQQRFPGIELIVETGTTESLVEEVRAQRLDLAIVMQPVEGPWFDIVPLGSEELVLVLSRKHPLARKQALGAADLNGLRFILYEKGTAMQNLIDVYFERLGIRPRITMELENIESIKSLVRAGLGASILPYCAVASLQPSDSLKPLRIKGRRLERSLALISLKSKMPPNSIREFARLTSDHLTRKPVISGGAGFTSPPEP